MRSSILAFAALTALGACPSSTPSAEAVPSSASDAAADACAEPTVVRARVDGSYERFEPRLRVVAGSMGSSPVVDLALAAPRFAAELDASDLCSDDGSDRDRLALRCLTGSPPVVQRVVVTRDGGGLSVVIGDKTSHFAPPPGMSACVSFAGLEHGGDLDALRRAWMRDEPACARGPGRPSVRVVLRLAPTGPRLPPPASGADRAEVTLLGLGAARSLGELSNLSGPSWIVRPADVPGISIEASDDATVRRFAYQLGDAVYYSDGHERVGRAPLPCGARATFAVEATGGLSIPERRSPL